MDAATGRLLCLLSPAELPGLCHTNPVLLGAITQSAAETQGTHSSPAFPRLRGSLVIFLPGFQKKRRRRRDGGNPHEFLENKRRHTKEEPRGREGSSWGESKTGGLPALGAEGGREPVERLDPHGWGAGLRQEGTRGCREQ